MSTVAIVPVAQMAAANDALELQDFGPRNFSVPAYTGAGATHAALHCWENTPFSTALSSIAGVVKQEGPLQTGVDAQGNPVYTDDPIVRTKALIEAHGAKWGAQAPMLPSSGNVTAGSLYQYAEANGSTSMWSVIQTFNRSTYGAHSSTYPALIRSVRDPYSVSAWRQPIDQYDAYKLVNAFTGAADKCTHNGQTWRVTQADGSGNNVWEPGVFGWTVV